MANNITTSNFKKLPAALLMVLALFLLTESCLYAIRADLIKDYWNKFLANEHVLVELEKDYEYLIMGDSVQKTGINPVLINDKLLNLGLPGSKPMSMYILLKRYLEKHKPPKVIFLYIDPEDAHDSLYVILRYFVSIPEFISIWKDLTHEERRVFMMRYWASLDMRKVGLAMRDKYPYSNSVFIKNMKNNLGYMPSPGSDKMIGEDYFSKNKERYQDKVSFSDNDRKYLDKFIALAASKDIKVVFLGFLLPKELHGIFEDSGFNMSYLSFFGELKRRYRRAYFVKEPIMFLDNRYFGDASHVNRNGSAIYTEYFKNNLFAPFERDK